MGYSADILRLLIFLRKGDLIANRGSIMEVGAQQLNNDFLDADVELEELRELFETGAPLLRPKRLDATTARGHLWHLDKDAPPARDFWRWLGFDYAAIDVDGTPDSLPLDLNFDSPPPELNGKFQLVTNYGTTEHVVNQLNAFNVIHALTAPGGFMVHEVPAEGYVGHGLIKYTFNFFWMLCRSNGYKIILADYSQSSEPYGMPEEILELIRESPLTRDSLLTRYSVTDGSIRIVLQKTHNIPFVPPFDIRDVGEVIFSEAQKRRYWTVFKPGTFSRLPSYARKPPQSRQPDESRTSLQDYRNIFEGLTPWRGNPPEGFIPDFLGTFTDARFRPLYNAGPLDRRALETTFPTIGDGGNGEAWFEAVNWLEAAKSARGRFIMISLGAHFGAQLVGAHRMLQLVNPMPCTLVAVEGEPSNYAWISEHMKANGIDPNEHWLIPMAISDTHEPVLFPVGAPGVGSNNCLSTNAPESRKIYADLIIRDGDPKAALRNLFLKNSTGFIQPVHPDVPIMTEVKVVSAVTLTDLLGPFDLIDYIEADIQQSEIVVFPPFMDELRKKVRRIHIGTHGADVHDSLHNLFVKNGWNIVFSFAPNAKYESELGNFELNDGVLTVTNPDLANT